MVDSVDSTPAFHVAAMPFPGRGHINPMMNFCKSLSSKHPHLLITFVVTREWLTFIAADPKPDNLRFATIPEDVIPAERLKASDFPGFYEAVMTKMRDPFEELLDRLEPRVTAVVADVEVLWGVEVGLKRNIPVALFWTMSAKFLSMLHRFNLSNRELDQMGELGEVMEANDKMVMKLALDCIAMVPRAQYLLFTSVYELEDQVFSDLQADFDFPVYPIGPAIPYLELECKEASSDNGVDCLKWLDSQPKGSVLYISLGSFLSVSSAQMDEIAAGLRNSRVRFIWVARGESLRLSEMCGDMGLVVPWCEQLKVLCHSSVGGFWSHCGWNSTLEAVFGGVPMVTFPLFLDQVPNSRQIVEEWRIGKRVKEAVQGDESLMTRDQIAELVTRFMDLESEDGKETRKRAKELSNLCHQAIAKGGSSDKNLDCFVTNIRSCCHQEE